MLLQLSFWLQFENPFSFVFSSSPFSAIALRPGVNACSVNKHEIKDRSIGVQEFGHRRDTQLSSFEYTLPPSYEAMIVRNEHLVKDADCGFGGQINRGLVALLWLLFSNLVSY